MIKISCIVTIYNMEKYIDRCMRSLLNQTLDEIEIILIDDSSTDSSWQIISRYKKKNSKKVKTIRNEKNLGAGSTRNKALRWAEGEYIAFIDCDDWVENTYCEELYKASGGNCDVVYCGCCLVDSQNRTVKRINIPRHLKGVMTDDKRKAFMLQQCAQFWAMIIKRSFIDNSKFQFMERQRFDEDIIAMFFPLMASRIGISDSDLYYWYQRTDSVSHVIKPHYIERRDAAELLYKEAVRLGLVAVYRDEIEFIYSNYFYINFFRVLSEGLEYRRFPYVEMKEAAELMKFRFPDYKNNRYIKWTAGDILELAILNDKDPRLAADRYFFPYKDYYMQKRDKLDAIFKFCQREDKKLAIWGAGKKGRALLACLAYEAKQVSYIFDMNEQIHGLDVDTGQIISSYSAQHDVNVILVMNKSHYNSVHSLVDNRNILLIDLDNYLEFNLTFKDDNGGKCIGS